MRERVNKALVGRMCEIVVGHVGMNLGIAGNEERSIVTYEVLWKQLSHQYLKHNCSLERSSKIHFLHSLRLL